MGKTILVQRWIGLAAGLAMLLLLRCPTLASTALTNAGVLTLRDGLMAQEELVLGTYPHYDILSGDLTTARAMRNLRRAVTLDGDSLPARWALGRAALALGNNEMAADALHFFITRAGQYSLLHSDVLTALSLGGQPEDVIAFYETDPPLQRTQAINDAVALAYLAQRGKDALENAKKLRPGDLYVNYHLWKWAQEVGDVQVAAAYSETLTYFPLEAIDPTDERLLDYAAQVIPALLEEGVWDREKTLNIVSYLVWQHNTAAGVMQLLENLTARYPAEPDWPFYLAELYHRRGDLDQAEMAYQRVLEIDTEYAQAYLRMGMVSEEASERGSESANQLLSEAVRWYAQYNALAPDDLLGLQRLTEICTALEDPSTEFRAGADAEDENCVAVAQRLLRTTHYVLRDPSDLDAPPQLDPNIEPAIVLQEVLTARTDDRRIVADLLDVPLEEVELGPNLVENGGFEEDTNEDKQPRQWVWSNMATGSPWNKGAFVGGIDFAPLGLEGNTLRVSGFWLCKDPDLPGARAGYVSRELTLLPKNSYLISFSYRTVHMSENLGGIWITSNPAITFHHERHLPATQGKWKRYYILGYSDSEIEQKEGLYLRSWGVGHIQFDQVIVKRVWDGS